MLKQERVVHQSHRTRDEARADIFDHIERFHNPRMRLRVSRQDLKFSVATLFSQRVNRVMTLI
ncbi:formate dehydrogenase subunit delta [Pseudomonas sp. ABC1]|nr:formate dehydrogenase subunit delta [Pseudomonas sp. ABC1]